MQGESHWTLLSNHAHVLVCMAIDPHIRLRDIAVQVGITERAVQRIVSELEDANMLERHREGRRNVYLIHKDEPLRHPLEKGYTVGSLIEAVTGQKLPKA